MAVFLVAFEKTLRHEGGYRRTNIRHDKGADTYAGISRRANPDWPGWNLLDHGTEPPAEWVRDAYRQGYWVPIQGDKITDQAIAETIYDFAVNAGTKTAIVLAQTVVGATPDGKMGPKTLAALNGIYPTFFVLAYFAARIKRYEQIVSKDRAQDKFLLGWTRRALNVLEASQ